MSLITRRILGARQPNTGLQLPHISALITTTVFRSNGESGLWIPHPDANAWMLYVTGPGGPSGGALCDAAANRIAVTCAGGAGGTAIGFWTRALIQALLDSTGGVPYVVGERGTAGAAGANGSGNTDSSLAVGEAFQLIGRTGEPSFGYTATTANPVIPSRRLGGNGEGGFANIKGQDSDTGWGAIIGAQFFAFPGRGGSSFWGGGSTQFPVINDGTPIANAGQSGVTPGAGASGAMAINSIEGAPGNRGGQGMILIQEFN